MCVYVCMGVYMYICVGVHLCVWGGGGFVHSKHVCNGTVLL